VNLINGRLFQAQRFAIDFVGVNPQGTNTFVGDPARNESYVLFGAEVLAVTAGRIVSMRNDLAENTPPNSPPIPPQNPDLAAGNYVVEALGSGRFALYAHLQPGSVRVSPGQTVQRGQVLGLVGNTGSSSEPHLHFHVMNRPSPLAANGLPYVFDRFRSSYVKEIDVESVVSWPGVGGWSRCQMRRARWRLRQRMASRPVLPSARLRAM
jgi:murein DD-endopeptidase MepM/ murein hydrolase activator NlpD